MMAVVLTIFLNITNQLILSGRRHVPRNHVNMVKRQMIKNKINWTDPDYKIPKDGAHRKMALEIDLQISKHPMKGLNWKNI